MSFLSKSELPTSVKSVVRANSKKYYHRKSTISESEKDEVVAEEKKKGRLVKVKLFQKQMGAGILSFTAFAIYSTK